MPDRFKTRTKSQTGTASLEFDDFELNAARHEFLKPVEKENGKNIWNFATISGLVLLFLSMTYLLQWIGLPIGEFLTDLSTGLIEATPLLGGVFVTLVGFGFLVGDRKREKKKKKNKRKWKEEEFEVHGSEFTRSKPSSGAQGNPTTSSSSRLGNDLDRDDTDDFSSYSQGSSYGSSSGTGSYEPYGYRHSKKLNKSRTDKKISGVCGGLARYFGVSSTVVRIIFVAAFFMGYGTSLLIYLGLALAMPKEPVDYMDDYNF